MCWCSTALNDNIDIANHLQVQNPFMDGFTRPYAQQYQNSATARTAFTISTSKKFL